MFRNQATIYNKIIIGLLTLMLVACGGNDSSNGQTDDVTTNRPAVATMPIPDLGKQSEITQTVESVSDTEPEDSGPDLALGERVYGNHCAECHGPEGQGGDAAPLTQFTLEFAAFENLLRTGGELGPEHLFGPQKVSPGGLDGLHAYLTK